VVGGAMLTFCSTTGAGGGVTTSGAGGAVTGVDTTEVTGAYETVWGTCWIVWTVVIGWTCWTVWS